MKKEKIKKEKSNVLKNLKYVLQSIHKNEQGFLFFNFISVIITSIYSFVPAYALKVIIDSLNSKDITAELINFTILKVALILGIALILNEIRDIIDKNTWVRVVRLRSKMILELNKKTMSFDYQTLEKTDTQDMIEKASNALGGNWMGYEGMYNYFKNILINLFSSVIACSIIFTAHYSLIIVITTVVIIKYITKNKVYTKDKKEFWDKLVPYRRKTNYVNNISNNYTISKDLRIYSMGKFIKKAETEVHLETHKLLKKSEKRRFKLEVFLTVVSIIQELAMYAILIFQVAKGNILPGVFTLMLASVQKLSSQLTFMFSNLAEMLYCSRQVNDLRKAMSFNDEYIKKRTCIPKSDTYTLEFRHVYYKYYQAEDYTLKDVSFIIKPREKIALVGYNGAGKTTITKLMMGLYHPTKGEILLNGENIENYNQNDYYKLFAPVFQETNCFNFDISENVAMKFSNDVDIKKATDALMVAGLMEKVNTLPDKIKTILMKDLDEKGIELSGGELQKLGLARAVYKNSPIIILDEPTSALDALAEYAMYNHFNEIISNSSAIYISHRLSSTHFCDKILLLKKGMIVEMGTHEELMKNKKDYYELFNLQAQYYKEGGDFSEEQKNKEN